MSRPPTQTKLSFGEDGELGAESPEEIEPVFKIGDKVVFNPEYPHMKGVFEVDGILLTWGEPLYTVIRYEKRKDGKTSTLMSCCTKEALIKVE